MRAEEFEASLGWGPSVPKALARLRVISDAAEQHGELPDARAALMHEEAAEVTAEEHAARVVEWIRTCAATFAALRGAGEMHRPAAPALLGPLAALTPSAPSVRPEDVWPLVCWLLGPALEAGAPAAMATLPVRDRVLPAKGRLERVAELQRRCAALITEHAQLVLQVHKDTGGQVSVEHLQENKQAVADKERSDALAEDAQAAQRERAALVNNHPQGPSRPHFSRSAYISGSQ